MLGFCSFAASPKTKELVCDSSAAYGTRTQGRNTHSQHRRAGPSTRLFFTHQTEWPSGKGGSGSGKQGKEGEMPSGLTTGRSGGQHTNSLELSWKKCLPSLGIWRSLTFTRLERGQRGAVSVMDRKGTYSEWFSMIKLT